jgi:hypothetical protein
MLHNNVHCWSVFGDKPATTCQLISQGGTLDKTADSFVTHVDDGFTRLLNGDPVGIMSVEETGMPSAFK